MASTDSDSLRACDERQPALSLIRSATAHCHARMERDVDWSSAFSTPTHYIELLQRFYRVVEPLESRLAQVKLVGGDSPDISRSASLLHDMAAMKSTYAIEACGDASDGFVMAETFVVDPTTAWGVRYVIEGSALGGQILSRQLQASKTQWITSLLRRPCSLESVVDRYFVGRGVDTGIHWRVFCQQLNEALSDEQNAKQAAQAAVETFEYFHLSLVGKAVCVRP